MANNNGGSIKRTLREKKFIESYIDNCGNATEAYLSISPDVTRDSAKELGKRMVAKVGLSIVEVLDKMGITNPVISKKLIDGLEATRETGTGKDKKEKADHHAIVKYLDMILKLKASYPADKAKLELTGKDGMLIGQTITLKKIVYITCPLKSQCPIKEKVEQAGDNYIKDQRIKSEKANVQINNN
ncbi:hypothetical protein ES708_30528 [subsurface metagenome]